MFSHIVTYHIYHMPPLPPYDAQAYQYLLAGNGLFVRCHHPFFTVLFPIHTMKVRGLPDLTPCFQLQVERLPLSLLTSIQRDVQQGWQTQGEWCEVLYHLYHEGDTLRLLKPRQQAGVSWVQGDESHAPNLLLDLHSHGQMAAFWSATDNHDEVGCRLYGVVGALDKKPEICLRVGVYGYWYPIPITAVFQTSGRWVDKGDGGKPTISSSSFHSNICPKEKKT